MTYFERVGTSTFRATGHVSGAWDPDEQHVAPALGLLVHVVERDRDARRDDGLVVARLSFDSLGTIPVEVVDTAVRVVRPDMTDVAPGEVGEIVYRGPTTMAGYWRNPAATAEAMRGGWFHSGDLVRADEEGFLFVVDRVKDMIISGGENIYCAEVEDVLAAHPAVREVSVVGRPHPRWGETPVAVVALRPEATLTLEELRSWARERLASYKLPTALEVVGQLPRNASGKVAKVSLRESFGGGLPG